MRQVLVQLLLFASLLDAQSWVQQVGATPGRRDTHGMTFEPVSQRVVVFGGFNANPAGQLNDTWEWDGASWVHVPVPSPPSPRETFAMCEDGTGGVLMFGGMAFQGGGYLGETWRYSQGSWTYLQPSVHPSARRYVNMTWTPSGPFLFGGLFGTTLLSDCWTWNGSTWVSQASAGGPGPRRSVGLAYDSARSAVVLFGGVGSQGALGDTWEWSPASGWQQRTPSHAPSPREGPAMAYSAPAGGCILFGGGYPSMNADTWLWDGVDWAEIPTTFTPPARSGHAMVFDALSGRPMVYGGYFGSAGGSADDAWHYSQALANFSPFGAGCSNSAGQTPVLGGVAPPKLGTLASIQVTNLPLAVTIPVFVYGLSNTVDSGPPAYPLPLDLGLFGWPGCQQLISDDVLFFEITTTGQAQHSIFVPLNPALVGQHYYAQAFVLCTPSGIAVSNGVDGAIGY